MWTEHKKVLRNAEFNLIEISYAINIKQYANFLRNTTEIHIRNNEKCWIKLFIAE